MLKICHNEAMKYFKKHPAYLAGVYFLVGIGLGILAARPVFATHPVRWGVILIGLAVVGYLYAWVANSAK